LASRSTWSRSSPKLIFRSEKTRAVRLRKRSVASSKAWETEMLGTLTSAGTPGS